MKIKPLQDRILVQKVKSKQVQLNGIIVLAKMEKRSNLGRVIDMGDDESVNENIKKGDIILYSKYGGIEMHMPGNDNLLLLNYNDVLAVVDGV